MTCCSQRPHLWLFALLAIVGLAADQASKYIAFARLYPDDREAGGVQPVVPGLFDLRTSYSPDYDPGDQTFSYLRTISGPRLPHVNKGALFGIGNDGSGMNTFFTGISILAAGFIIFWTSRPIIARDHFLCLALGMILGGTLGNLYDRIVFGGVRDFLHCYYGPHVWPDFNIADCCLVCGAGVLLAHSFFVNETAPKHTPAEPVTAVTPAPMQTTSSNSGV